MKENILELKRKFDLISKKGYIKGIYNHPNASGRTFEEELGLPINKECVPDYKGIEIKTRRTYSKSPITLFSAVPDGEDNLEINRITNTYGYPYKKDRRYKCLYANIYGNKLNFAGVKYQYKLDIDRKEKRIYLCVYDFNDYLIERKVYWSFALLKERLLHKLKVMTLVHVWPNKIDGWNYFKYYKMDFYVLKSFNKFIKLIEAGKIILDLKVDIYLDERNYGKLYKHGCSFKISEEDLRELFYVYDLKTNKLK